MKKFKTVIVALLAVMILVSCGSKKETDITKQTEAVKKQTEEANLENKENTSEPTKSPANVAGEKFGNDLKKIGNVANEFIDGVDSATGFKKELKNLGDKANEGLKNAKDWVEDKITKPSTDE